MTQYISYKNKKYPVRISYSALNHLRKESGKDLSEILGTSDDVSYLEILLWYGLISGAKAEDIKLELDRSECEFILDESLSEFNAILSASFAPLTEESDKKK